MSEELDLDAIEARANAATEGPWFATNPLDPSSEWASDYDDPMVVTGDSEPGNYSQVAAEIRQGHDEGVADAEFIAHARTDVPALVAEVRRLRERDLIRGEWIKERADRVAQIAAESDALRAQRDAVLALHERGTGKPGQGWVDHCRGCGYEYPCPTARALGVTK